MRIDKIKMQLHQLKTSATEGKPGKMRALKHQLEEAYRDDENFWFQKARSKWLQEGDKNTKYFDAQVNGRRKQNKVQKLMKVDGTWAECEEELGLEVSEYYNQFFTKTTKNNVDEILEGIPKSITRQMNQELVNPIEEKEIKDAFFSMHNNKAPRIDGMSPLFFFKISGISLKEMW